MGVYMKNKKDELVFDDPDKTPKEIEEEYQKNPDFLK